MFEALEVENPIGSDFSKLRKLQRYFVRDPFSRSNVQRAEIFDIDLEKKDTTLSFNIFSCQPVNLVILSSCQ